MKVNKKRLKLLRKLKQIESEIYVQPKARRLLDAFGLPRSGISLDLLKRLKTKT